MNESIKNILNDVLKRIKPKPEIYEDIARRVNYVKEKLYEALNKHIDSPNDVFIGGSFARKTFLRDEYDVDIFIRYPLSIDLKNITKLTFDVSYKIFGRDNIKARYANHPYVEAYIDGIRFNVVPCYKVELLKWRTPVDRTYYHTMYLANRINEELIDEILLFKSFLKGLRVYGAEVSIKGFSGYLTELIILYYKGFIDAITNISKWRNRVIIDIEKHYKSIKEISVMFPRDPLIFIDPIDKGRNVASSLSRENYARLISAAKSFLSHPSKIFFYPYSIKALKQYIYSLDFNKVLKLPIIAILLEHGVKIEDIYHSQLEKLARKIVKQLEINGIEVIKHGVYSNYMDRSIILIMTSDRFIPQLYKMTGPYPTLMSEEDYLIKNVREEYLWIDDDMRWHKIGSRIFRDVKSLVKYLLESRKITIPKDIIGDRLTIKYIDELDEHELKEVEEWIRLFVKGVEYWRSIYS